jgi:hypothetical protein
MRSVIVLGCLLALPVFAQTTTTTTTTTTTKTKHVTHHATASRTRVWNEATRLAALLNDAQNDKTTFSDTTWKAVANEANMLANRIYASSGGRAAARDIRMHVREMRAAALKGDAAGARSHASQALPFVYQIIDWAMPASS